MTVSAGLPLFAATAPTDPIGWRQGRPVDAGAFLAAVEATARRFGPGRHVLNLCTDRLAFASSFCATVLAGRISLQPPNHSPDTIARLRADFPDLQTIDDETTVAPVASSSTLAPLAGAAWSVPRIPSDQIAALVFTSGSTGRPTAHPKRWGSLIANVGAAARRLGVADTADRAMPRATVIGTVPAQHMYGFESTVLLALHNRLTLHGATPFFPADIAATLADVAGPAVLVTTPFHLRTLLAEAPAGLPPVRFVLSATAPLDPALARQAEQAFGAPLLEIYGCTEAGQIATRRPAHGSTWETFDGLRVDSTINAQGATVWQVSGGHVDTPTPLGDLLEVDTPQRFRLLGRGADMVNIAGKRSSLAHLNQLLLDIDGVRDGAFHDPGGSDDAVVRLVAFYVSDHLEPAAVLAALRRSIDPAFLPRPLHRVASLPRAATGKLPQAALADLARQLQTRGADRR